MTRLVVNHAPDFLQSDREVAGDARHDRVGVSARDHSGGEVIAILVDHALAIAEQVALPLQPLVEELGVNRIALGKASVVNLNALVRKIETRRLGDAAHAVFPANQNGLAETLIDE